MRSVLAHKARAFKKGDDGTTMVEFAICISLFLLILFAVLDFGRLGYNWVMAEKAMQRAVRIAAVRPPICTGVPDYHTRANVNDPTYPAGTNCRAVPGLCFAAGPIQCTLDEADSTDAEVTAAANEIWLAVQALLPNDASRANVSLSYAYDPNLGFLGGPFVPLITAELVGPNDPDQDGTNDNCGQGNYCFAFVTPLSALAATAGAANAEQINADDANTQVGATIPFPGVSVSLPAEDMNLGSRG